MLLILNQSLLNRNRLISELINGLNQMDHFKLNIHYIYILNLRFSLKHFIPLLINYNTNQTLFHKSCYFYFTLNSQNCNDNQLCYAIIVLLLDYQIHYLAKTINVKKKKKQVTSKFLHLDRMNITGADSEY